MATTGRSRAKPGYVPGQARLPFRILAEPLLDPTTRPTWLGPDVALPSLAALLQLSRGRRRRTCGSSFVHVG